MNKYIGLLFVFALSSEAVSAECKPGYQSAKVAKVLNVSPGAAAQPGPTRNPRSPAAPSARLVIFSARGQQYELRLPPGSDLPGGGGGR